MTRKDAAVCLQSGDYSKDAMEMAIATLLACAEFFEMLKDDAKDRVYSRGYLYSLFDEAMTRVQRTGE